MITKAARRYAKAYFQIAVERDELEVILSDVQLMHGTISTSRDLTLFLRSPIINADVKQRALDELFSDKANVVTREFLHFLVKKGREDMLEQITESFLALYNLHIGRVEAVVQTALPLSDDQKKKLTSALERSTGKTVRAEFQEHKELIGGLSVRIGDTVIDGTVKNKIGQLKSLFTRSVTD